MFPVNNQRAKKQRALDIRVILGNPPYSVGQNSANDDNANLKYPRLDASITSTYAKRSSAANKNKLYGSYLRAIRWASDSACLRAPVTFNRNVIICVLTPYASAAIWRGVQHGHHHCGVTVYAQARRQPGSLVLLPLAVAAAPVDDGRPGLV